MNERIVRFGTALWLAAMALSVRAFPVKVEAAHPQRYACGETATFHVTLGNAKKGVPTNGVVTAVLSNYGTRTISTNMFNMAKGASFDVSGALDEPGFLLLTLSGAPVDRNWGGGTHVTSVAYEPERVQPAVGRPADFAAYWRGELARLEATVPADVRLEPCEKGSNDKRVLHRVSFATFGGRRVWGFLSEPRNKVGSPYPARVNVPGAGAGINGAGIEGNDREIVLVMNVHYYEPTFERGGNGALLKEEEAELAGRFGVAPRPYQITGIEGAREDYFYHDAIVGIVRAVNWLYVRPGVDRSRFSYEGTSQGGGFGLILGGLFGRFSRLVAYVPALCDPCGYKVGRRAGWPRFGDYSGYVEGGLAKAEANAPYYDAVNFASLITCPICFVAGLSDSVCPPAGATLAYAACPSQDKSLVLVPNMTHSVFRDVYTQWNAWSRSGSTFDILSNEKGSLK